VWDPREKKNPKRIMLHVNKEGKGAVSSICGGGNMWKPWGCTLGCWYGYQGGSIQYFVGCSTAPPFAGAVMSVTQVVAFLLFSGQVLAH
jgi:hypothetical protein